MHIVANILGDEVEMAKDIRSMIDISIPNKHFFECKLCAFDTHVKADYDEQTTFIELYVNQKTWSVK